MAAPSGPRRSFFDVWSRVYDAPVMQTLVYRPVHRAVVASLTDRPGQRVLDIGCGTGQLAERVSASRPETTVVGCDFSQGMLEQASQRAGPVWVRGDAQRLPFADGTFHAVVSTHAFHWFPDQRAALRELHRVTTSGGGLLLALVNPPFEGVSRAARRASAIAGEPFHWPTRRAIREDVEAAGYRVTRQHRILGAAGGLLLAPVLTHATK